MLNRLPLVTFLCTCAVLIGCGDDAQPNAAASDQFEVLFTSSDVAAGDETCPDGGTRIEAGLDNGDGDGTAEDGILQDGEVDETTLVCRGAAAATGHVLATSTPFDSSENCPDGGSTVEYGVDDGSGEGEAGDDALHPDEVTDTLEVCDSEHVIVSDTRDLAVGDAECALGGTEVRYGADDGDGGGVAGNDTLEVGEVDEAITVCNAPGGDVVIETIELPYGSEACAAGGRVVNSGLDDGVGGGVAADGILDAAEIESSLTQCEVSIEDLFEAVDGDVGSGRIELSGGDAVDTAEACESGDGGPGGSLSINVEAGAVPVSAELLPIGEVDTDFDLPDRDFVAGSNPVVVDSLQTPLVLAEEEDPPAEGLYLIEGEYPNLLILSQEGAPVTSVHITAEGELAFAYVHPSLWTIIEGDVWNEGVLTTEPFDVSSYGTALHLILSGSFWNDVEALVHTSGVRGAGEIVIESGPESVFVNAGLIDTHTVGNRGRAVTIHSGGAFYNSGIIDTHGSSDQLARTKGVPSGSGYSGGDVTVYLYSGGAFLAGEFIAHGGAAIDSGTGGRGATISIGPADASALTNHPAPVGGHRVISSATFDLHGGHSEGGRAGSGGSLRLTSVVGPLRVGGEVDAEGGSSAGNTGGAGGSVSMASTLFIDESGAIATPASAQLSGTLQLGGGLGCSGGAGGTLTVQADLTETPSGWYAEPPLLAPLYESQPFRVQLLGYGGPDPAISANGGSTEITGEGDSQAAGGSVDVQLFHCADCVLDRVGARWIVSDVDVELRAGDTVSRFPAQGGSVTMLMNQVDGAATTGAAFDETRLESNGVLDLRGATGEAAPGGLGGSLRLGAHAGAVIISGDVLAGGGQDCTTCVYNSSVTREHALALAALDLSVDALLDFSDHDPPQAEITALNAVLGGTISLAGVASPEGWEGTLSARGGRLAVRVGERLEWSGDLDLRGADAFARQTGSGGSLTLHAGTLVIDGTMDASGGNTEADTEVQGGFGGHLSLLADHLTINGTLRARSGDRTHTTALETPPTESRGGTVTIRGDDVTNNGTIDVSGGIDDNGDAETATHAGNGGTVDLVGDNAGTILAVGGGSAGAEAITGGDGGTVTVGGANTGCINVGASDGGAAGTVQVDGADTGSCP